MGKPAKKEKGKEGREVKAETPAGAKGKKKVKAKGEAKSDDDSVASAETTTTKVIMKQKGKRFDIGRVIHAFLDARPSKKASFAQVTSRVLEEFKLVKIQPDMEEKRLVNKINKKIELNPNINVKNGEIILV